MVSKAEGLFRAVVRNAAVLLGGRTVNAVLGLSALAVAGRALGLHNFGLLVLIHAFAEAVGDVARFQSWQSVLHYGAKPLGEKRIFDFQRIVRFSAMLDVISSFVGVVIGVVGAAFIGPLLGWPDDAAPAAMIYSTSIVFMVTATPTGVLRLFNRFDLIAYQSTIASAVWLIGGALAFIFGLGLKTFLLVWWLGTFAAFVFLFIASWRELRRRGCLEGLTWRMGSLTHGFPGLWRFALTTNATATLELAFNHVSTPVRRRPAEPLAGGAVAHRQAGGRRHRRAGEAGGAPPSIPSSPSCAPTATTSRWRGWGCRSAPPAGPWPWRSCWVTSLAGKPVLSLVMGKVFAPRGRRPDLAGRRRGDQHVGGAAGADAVLHRPRHRRVPDAPGRHGALSDRPRPAGAPARPGRRRRRFRGRFRPDGRRHAGRRGALVSQSEPGAGRRAHRGPEDPQLSLRPCHPPKIQV
ncbi:MAG: lipopolysaccharide biosynthesis protein [Caulobacteraceae bacterium]